ncbi:hypothetical protein NDU88_006416 [Pleurodeles waltl]|uniref:Uncharacterized protein n=1 Tax=Pleurodeles waltl TaxID=8319 RepID=A0AAV7WAI6_PLEWA|nr:hypothetical protein NDU88_006416 [Pleurodeles waltl]
MDLVRLLEPDLRPGIRHPNAITPSAIRRHIPLLDAAEGVAVPVADEGDMGSDEEDDEKDAADSRAQLIQ